MNENKSGKTLRVDDVTFRYGNSEQPIIDGFSAVFPYGKITALTGENGCGKTTLARIIMGILKPEKGTVMLGDDDLCGYSLAQTGRRIGYVMQDPSRQIFSLSVDEEVRYGLKNMDVPCLGVLKMPQYSFSSEENEKLRRTLIQKYDARIIQYSSERREKIRDEIFGFLEDIGLTKG